jgi:hypothetical protein
VEADQAVEALGWQHPFYVDADHIKMDTVEGFLAGSDFFTLDVADYVGEAPEADALESWLDSLDPYFGEHE